MNGTFSMTGADAATLKADYDRDGYAVARGVFSPDEVATLREHFMALRAKCPHPHDYAGVKADDKDPLKRFPRMIHMHRWDETSKAWMLDPRIIERLTLLLGVWPYAVQTMLYFKPPGARGQAMHQDNYYLKASPGTCMAAWMALDPCDVDNGCMHVVPGSHKWPLLCVTKANIAESFTHVTVPLPETERAVPVLMQPGDVLFFGGSMVHGSTPNTTPDRFRRALIGHYIECTCTQLTKFDQPILKPDGTELEIEAPGEEGGACGEWVDTDGQPVIEVTGVQPVRIDVE
jgi:ectoine hydroxylase-related dioxygenase (phytanoyl-CoA dioxygenase family)